MKKVVFLVVLLAGGAAFYQQTMPEPNLWISAIGIGIFMLGLLFLSQKATRNSTSDSESQEDDK